MSDNETNTVNKTAGTAWKDSHPEVGALWIKEGKGQKFMSGYVEVEGGEKKRVIVYSNKYKDQNDNAPDFRMYLSLSDASSGSSGVDAFDSLSSPSQGAVSQGAPSQKFPSQEGEVEDDGEDLL